MSFEYVREIPGVKEILSEIPLSAELKSFKSERDQLISGAFKGATDKFLLVIGPCSADNEDAVCEYVNRLSDLQSKVEDQIILIPRIYTNKPRTTGVGYKGMGHQPNPQEDPNIVEGLKAIRRMHIRALDESKLTAADEMLYPGNYPYLEDLLSYVAIGARSVENQQHRLTVSGLDIPIGMKNPTSGDLNVMLNSVQAAQAPHVFIYNGWEVSTKGNSLTHCILRGAFDSHGQNIPNFRYEDIVDTIDLYEKRSLDCPAIIVDTSHANSNKKFGQQPRIAKNVLASMKSDSRVRSMVKGLMIESYLVAGAQKVGGETFGQSITDPCLGWDDSKELVLEIAEILQKL